MLYTWRIYENITGKESETDTYKHIIHVLTTRHYLFADGKIFCCMFAFGCMFIKCIHLGNLYQAAHSCENMSASYSFQIGLGYLLFVTLSNTQQTCTLDSTYIASG